MTTPNNQQQQPFIIIAGPCILEGADGAINFQAARHLKAVTEQFGNQVKVYFKSSFDKANRTSVGSYRGEGMVKGVALLQRIKEEVGLPILTDVHSWEQCEPVAKVADFLQIPAFLCRQTDLLVAAGETGKPINVKKGQFLSPPEVQFCADKVKSTGNEQVYICERGTTFGYNTLVVDMRSFPIVKSLGLPIIFDATHSVQQPGGLNGKSGGNRAYAPVLARAATTAGCDGLFFEMHPNPDQALSDGPNQIPFEWVEPLIAQCLEIRALNAKAESPWA
ncbi:MAG: 3-deoxy-8-phosphooctulonate synthase [Candidatus Melainabacteria bacterium]|nr:3-deoxy-8-phosphooctulonate synthase [Candidatus Melainabacteria bacterium]